MKTPPRRKAKKPLKRPAAKRRARGLFLSFEGGEGAGKSTQIQLLAESMRAHGHAVVLTREPGGSEIANRIRGMILDPAMQGLVPLAELLLYEASRAQHMEDTILPALEKGAVVICDRFTDSSIVYQGAARGLDARLIDRLNLVATGGLQPKRTFFLDIDPREGLARARGRGEGLDRMEAEGLAFHEAVRKGYKALARKEPRRIRVVNAAQEPEKVHSDILDELKGLI